MSFSVNAGSAHRRILIILIALVALITLITLNPNP